jgi:hypothetical protein
MTLPVPNLDDRVFVDLVEEALAHATRICPEWTDHSVHDPGVALVEVFAHLTEVMLYRLNRLPERAYVEFLNLLGVARHPPSAAWAELTVTRTPNGSDRTVPVLVPSGTQVVAARGAGSAPVVFTVTDTAVLPAGQDQLTVHAYHCDLVDGELVGHGTGGPGQVFQVARAPIVTTAEELDVLMGVEVPAGSVPPGAPAREFGGKTFEIWRPVTSFAGHAPTDKVYVLRRSLGLVTFAPALDLRTAAGADLATVAAVPPSGREIRVWYRCGGGPAGNVAANTLTTLRSPISGVSVTNPVPARGGRAMELIEAAVARGPYEFFALERAVTARDYELCATSGSAGVARAKAYTRATMWSFARPGEVETVLVPFVGESERPGWRLSAEVLAAHEDDEVRRRTQSDLDSRRALGTTVVTTWARYKAVAVHGRVVVRAEDDPDAVRRRIHDRLHQTISPLSTPTNPSGWAFGEPLRASNVYRWLESAEPGVRYVDDVRFVLPEAPDGRVRAVAADAYQPGTWYAGMDETVFRSTNGGRGWELAGRFPGETVRRVVPAPAPVRPGVGGGPGAVAVVTRLAGDAGSAVYASADLGESWRRLAELDPAVEDAAWIDRDGVPALLLATDAGLYELTTRPGAVPIQIAVDAADPDRGFYVVRAFVSEHGVRTVAVAAQARAGVYLSTSGGRTGTFVHSGLSGVDTRTLAVREDGGATTLWAGTGEADPRQPGQGCFSARLYEADVRWQAQGTDWSGGTCWDLAFDGSVVLAATQSGGVQVLDGALAAPRWRAADVNGGLPLRDRGRFEPVESVAATGPGACLAGTARGVFHGDGARWTPAANRTVRDVVTVPPTWLLCSGEHDIEVVHDDASTGH